MALIHDSPDVRLMVFRIGVGQMVPLHASGSSVLLYVLSGCGMVSDADGDHTVHPGMVVAYEPREAHGMQAISEELVLLAIIAPRPLEQRGQSGLQSRLLGCSRLIHGAVSNLADAEPAVACYVVSPPGG